MGKLTVQALRVVLVVVLAGTVFVQAATLLAQAVARDVEATQLRAELDEVI